MKILPYIFLERPSKREGFNGDTTQPNILEDWDYGYSGFPRLGLKNNSNGARFYYDNFSYDKSMLSPPYTTAFINKPCYVTAFINLIIVTGFPRKSVNSNALFAPSDAASTTFSIKKINWNTNVVLETYMTKVPLLPNDTKIFRFGDTSLSGLTADCIYNKSGVDIKHAILVENDDTVNSFIHATGFGFIRIGG